MYHIECICIDIIYMSKNKRSSRPDEPRTIVSMYVRGILSTLVMLYFFVGVIFIHKISANDDALNTIFPTDNHTKIVQSWFIGRLVSELVYKTLDANNRNVHSFLRAMRNVNRGMGYILFVVLVIGIFSVMSTLWLVYGAVITFGQAFIFNMTLPIGWIRSLIILWSVGVASLVSGAVMVLYNFIMIFYIPFNYSGNLKELCGGKDDDPKIMDVVKTYIMTLVYLFVMGIFYISSLINFGSKYSYTPIVFKTIMLLLTLGFSFAERNIEYTEKNTEVKCQSKKTGGETDDKFNNNDIFNAILSGDQGYVPKEKLDELSKDFTRFLYTKLLESKMAESGVLPPEAERELAVAKKSAEKLTNDIDELQKNIKRVQQKIDGLKGSLDDDNLDEGLKELRRNEIVKLDEELSKYEKEKEIKSESLGNAKAQIDSISPKKPDVASGGKTLGGNPVSPSAPPEDNNEVASGGKTPGGNPVSPSAPPEDNNEVVPDGDKVVAPDGDKVVAPDGDKVVAPDGDKVVVPDGDKVVVPDGDKVVAPDDKTQEGKSDSPSTPPQDENKEGLKVNDLVYWKKADNDIPAGSIGRVSQFHDDDDYIEVQFDIDHPKKLPKAFSLHPDKLTIIDKKTLEAIGINTGSGTNIAMKPHEVTIPEGVNAGGKIGVKIPETKILYQIPIPEEFNNELFSEKRPTNPVIMSIPILN